MSKSFHEKHSLATLAQRFAGLASRNTIHRWIEQGKLKPDLTDRSAAPYLFRRDVLDAVAKELEKAHDTRIRAYAKKESEFRRIRALVRQNCLQRLTHNQMAEFSRKPHLKVRELDPALDLGDAVGAVRLENTQQKYTLRNCDLQGTHYQRIKSK